MTMTEYDKSYNDGVIDVLNYMIARGQKLLENENITDDMAVGICLILGIAKAKKDSFEEAQNENE